MPPWPALINSTEMFAQGSKVRAYETHVGNVGAAVQILQSACHGTVGGTARLSLLLSGQLVYPFIQEELRSEELPAELEETEKAGLLYPKQVGSE